MWDYPIYLEWRHGRAEIQVESKKVLRQVVSLLPNSRVEEFLDNNNEIYYMITTPSFAEVSGILETNFEDASMEMYSEKGLQKKRVYKI